MKKILIVLFILIGLVFTGCLSPVVTPTETPVPTETLIPTIKAVDYKEVKVVSYNDSARLFYIAGWNDQGRPIFLPAYKDNGKPALVLVNAILTVYLYDLSRPELKFEDNGAIIGDSNITCYLIASGSLSSGLSASGYFIQTYNAVDW